jgi:hypothetical protein
LDRLRFVTQHPDRKISIIDRAALNRAASG